MKTLFVLLLMFVLVIFSCQNEKCRLYDSGHLQKAERDITPEPDLILRLNSMYEIISEEKLNVQLSKERYLANKYYGELTSETDLIIGRNKINQVIYLEEFIVDRYSDKPFEIIQTYFFDKYGRTFAIEQHMNSVCNHSDAHQTIIRFYNSAFELIDIKYSLLGTEGEVLDKRKCGSDFDETLGISSNYTELLNTYKFVKEKE
ncbi:hypothetical protein [Flammeovirga sp. SubArs3]|uniref:hypothetical protein n=1 Tax=Flammeovirga sp. SubArs3 TaxID=2995316 RepID=UPI00248D0223|nr:hypothetical protein [Flammeovirga sp. SubArs3]